MVRMAAYTRAPTFVNGGSRNAGLTADQVGTVNPVDTLVGERTLSDSSSVKRSRNEAAALGNRMRAPQHGPAEWSTGLQAEVVQRHRGASRARRLHPERPDRVRMLRRCSSCRPIRREKPPPNEVETGVREILPAELAAEVVARYEIGQAPRALRVPSRSA